MFAAILPTLLKVDVITMKNKLLRLIEIVQDGYPEELLAEFKAKKVLPLKQRIELIGLARDFHQNRADELWLANDKQRSANEKQAAAQADLARFVFGCLTGDAKEYSESATAAMITLGRQGEIDTVKNLAR